MCDEWMPAVGLPLSPEQFRELPRNPAYRYEYLDGQARLTPRPRHYHGLLELRLMAVDTDVPIRRIEPTDLSALEEAFAASFARVQPFGSLDDTRLAEAARDCLTRTVTGGDGPWIERASFVAVPNDTPIGAVFVTLLPDGDPCEWDSYCWPGPPPADAVRRRLGRPHLTWIFVAAGQTGEGVGTALLAAAVNELLALGYTELASTFLLGNDSSMLWHWRNGFRLLPYPGSKRQMRRRRAARAKERK